MPQEMKQICVFSATYPTELEAVLQNFMREPTLLHLNVEEEQLVGIKEYCVFCDGFKKADALKTVINFLKACLTLCLAACPTCLQSMHYFLRYFGIVS